MLRSVAICGDNCSYNEKNFSLKIGNFSASASAIYWNKPINLSRYLEPYGSVAEMNQTIVQHIQFCCDSKTKLVIELLRMVYGVCVRGGKEIL